MADEYKVKYSDALNGAEAVSLNSTDVFALAQEDAGSETGFTSKVCRLLALASKMLKGIDYSTDLNTTSKNVFGAINEVNGTAITGTLTAGQTSLTLSDAAIETTSTIDYYTDIFGVSPTNAVVTTGQIVLTFPEQASDLGVKVVVK